MRTRSPSLHVRSCARACIIMLLLSRCHACTCLRSKCARSLARSLSLARLPARLLARLLARWLARSLPGARLPAHSSVHLLACSHASLACLLLLGPLVLLAPDTLQAQHAPHAALALLALLTSSAHLLACSLPCPAGTACLQYSHIRHMRAWYD